MFIWKFLKQAYLLQPFDMRYASQQQFNAFINIKLNRKKGVLMRKLKKKLAITTKRNNSPSNSKTKNQYVDYIS